MEKKGAQIAVGDSVIHDGEQYVVTEVRDTGVVAYGRPEGATTRSRAVVVNGAELRHADDIGWYLPHRVVNPKLINVSLRNLLHTHPLSQNGGRDDLAMRALGYATGPVSAPVEG